MTSGWHKVCGTLHNSRSLYSFRIGNGTFYSIRSFPLFLDCLLGLSSVMYFYVLMCVVCRHRVFSPVRDGYVRPDTHPLKISLSFTVCLHFAPDKSFKIFPPTKMSPLIQDLNGNFHPPTCGNYRNVLYYPLDFGFTITCRNQQGGLQI